MVKLIALYRQPDDPEAFDAHYYGVHLPIVRRMPGLKMLVVTKLTSVAARAASPYYLLAEMTFDDRDALKAALSSEVGREAGRDLQGFAGSLVEMMVGTTVDGA
ncbi:MAG: EthD family reductase [Firmicutes bacterium]|nr:EthD family reductase [Bacillota bacterium]